MSKQASKRTRHRVRSCTRKVAFKVRKGDFAVNRVSSGRTWRDSVPFAILVLFVTLFAIPAVVIFAGWLIGDYVGIIVACVVLLIPLSVLNS
jgi:hypothetical protein